MENQNLNNDNQNSASQQNESQPNQESENQIPNQEPKDTNVLSNDRHSGLDPESRQKQQTGTSEQEVEDMLAGTDDVQDIPTQKNTVIPSSTGNLEQNNNIPKPTVPPVTDEQPASPVRHSGLDPESSLPGQEQEQQTEQPTPPTPSDESTPVAPSHPEPTTPPPVDNTPTQTQVASEPKPDKSWIWWIVAGIVILALATTGTYFLGVWPFADKPSILAEEPVERFVPLLHRTSTLPTGELKIIGNTVIANISNLATSATGQFIYKLVVSNDTSEQELGSFVGTNIGGNLIDDDGNVVTLASSNIEDYNMVKVIMHNTRNESEASTILQGALSQNTAELSFPYDFLNINAGVILEEVQSGENLVEFTFDNLPNVADIGYIYEARLAEFDGPYVTDELSLGKFAGTGQKTTFTATTDQRMIKYNQLVISLEPTWDNDPAISQIKPFSGNI